MTQVLKIRRRTYPLAAEGELNRTKAELAEALGRNEATPFTAETDYQAGEIISKGARMYVTTQVIVKGETVTPGVNCEETTMADVITSLKAKEE